MNFKDFLSTNRADFCLPVFVNGNDIVYSLVFWRQQLNYSAYTHFWKNVCCLPNNSYLYFMITYLKKQLHEQYNVQNRFNKSCVNILHFLRTMSVFPLVSYKTIYVLLVHRQQLLVVYVYEFFRCLDN